MKKIKQILKVVGIKTADRDEETPLHRAAKSGDVVKVNALLEKRADVHAIDINGYTLYIVLLNVVI